MNIVGIIASAWSIPPVRWAVYATVILWLLFVYVMRLKRIRDGRGLSWLQKIVGYPIAVIALIVDWAYNWTVAAVVFMEPPKAWDELTTQRMQRVLDNPDTYGGYRLTLVRWWKPKLNEHDPGHLE